MAGGFTMTPQQQIEVMNFFEIITKPYHKRTQAEKEFARMVRRKYPWKDKIGVLLENDN